MNGSPLIGRTLAGTYEVLEEIGRGAMGVVYRARHRHLDHEAAVKVLRRELVDDEEALGRFRREAEVLLGITHENVVPIRLYGVDEDRPFLVMDYCEGRSLAELLEEEDTLPESRARRITRQILAGLGAAHAKGVVHRDLKPANVMIESGDHVRVLDFGLSRLTGGGHAVRREALLTHAGDLLGTLAYMAPEQARGETDIDARADLFAVGVMLHEMLSGHLPFEADSLMSMMKAIIQDPAPRLEVASERTRAALSRALAKDRDARFQSAAEFDAALGRSTPGPEVAGRGRSRRMWGVAALASVAGLATAALLGQFFGEDADPEALRDQARSAIEGCAPGDALDLLRRLHREHEAEMGPADYVALAKASVQAKDADADRDVRRALDRVPKASGLHALAAREIWQSRRDLPAALERVERGLTATDDTTHLVATRVELLVEALAVDDAHAWRPGMLERAWQDVQSLPQEGADAAVTANLRAQLGLFKALAAHRADQRTLPHLSAAEHDARLAIRLAPGWAAPHATLARILQERAAEAKREGSHESAYAFRQQEARALSDALDLTETNPHVRCQTLERGKWLKWRGMTYLSLGETASGLADMREYAAADGGTEARYHLTLLLREHGLLEEASAELRALIPLTRDQVHYFDLAFCQQQLGRVALWADDPDAARTHLLESIEAYDEAIEVDPESASAHAYRGEVRLRLAALDTRAEEELLRAARRDFERAAALDMTARDAAYVSGEVAIRYVLLLAREGKPEQAVEMLEAAAAEQPDPTARTYTQLSRLYLGVASQRLLAGDLEGMANALAKGRAWLAQLPRILEIHDLVRAIERREMALLELIAADEDARAARLRTWHDRAREEEAALAAFDGDFAAWYARELAIRRHLVRLIEDAREGAKPLATAYVETVAEGRFPVPPGWLNKLADALLRHGDEAAVRQVRAAAAAR